MGGVAVLGTGAWGTTLAILVARERERQSHKSRGKQMPAPQRVCLWEHRPERAETMERERENATYLPGCPFPANLRVTSNLAEAVADCDLVLLVTPSQRVREHARALAPLLVARDGGDLLQQRAGTWHEVAHEPGRCARSCPPRRASGR